MIRSTLHDLRRTWPQLLVTDLAARAFSVLAVVPLIGLLLKLFLLTADDGVLTDTDIAVFILHPTGLLALLLVATIGGTLLFVEQGVLMVIGFGALENRRITWLDGVRHVYRHAAALATLAGRVIIQVLILASPFLAATGAIYLLFLREFDINYYLTDRPPAFWNAITLTSLLGLAFAGLLLRKIAGWIISIPLVLFDNKKGKEALHLSEQATSGEKWPVALWLLAWLAGVFLLSMAATSAISLLGNLIVPALSGSLVLVALGLGTTLLVAGLVNLSVTVTATAAFPLLVLRLYRNFAGPGHLEGPSEQPLGNKPVFDIPGMKYLVSIGVILVLVITAGHIFTESIDDDTEIAIIAHRGASGAAPENTMAAFERAITDKADWIELDVQEDADGRIIVAHDSDFMKLAGNPLKVWNATEEDLRTIDIGGWFGPSFTGQRVPTLKQVLELARDRIGVVIELKYYGHDERLEQRVVEIVEETGMQDSIKLMSLKREVIMKAAVLRPEWPRGLLNTASLGDLTKLDFNFLALNSAASSSRMIRRAHEKGTEVYSWTINDPVQMSVMMSRGVDGVITDEPAMARDVMEFRQQLSPFANFLLWVAGESGFLYSEEESSQAEDA